MDGGQAAVRKCSSDRDRFGRGSMAMASAVMFRKVARIACLVLFVGLLFGGAATAQLPITAPAPVTVGSVVPFSHGSTGTWGQIYQMAVAPNGTILFLDAPGASLYALAPGATQPTLLAGPVASGGSSNCSTLEQANNSDWNSSLIVDKNNTIYIGDRYGSAVAYCVIPYVNGAWTFQASDNWTTGEPVGCTTGAGSQCTSGTEVIWPQSMAIGDDGTIYVGSSGNTDGSGIWSFTVTNGVASTPTALAVELEADASSIAVDHAGNLFFLENVYGSPSSRVDGIREIVKGSPTVVGTSGSGSGLEASLPRIDEGFQGVSGLAFDAWGNLYFGSQQNSAYGGEVNGVFMIPNEGTPKAPNLVWADTVRVSPVYSGFYPLVDPRGYLWIADGGGGSNWGPTGTIAPVCSTKTNTTIDQTCTSSSVVLWAMGGANVGTSPVGTPGPVQTRVLQLQQAHYRHVHASRQRRQQLCGSRGKSQSRSHRDTSRAALHFPAPRTRDSAPMRLRTLPIAGANTLCSSTPRQRGASPARCKLSIPVGSSRAATPICMALGKGRI
jgi:hypothetical protein